MVFTPPKNQVGKNKTRNALREGGGPLELGTGWGPPQEVFTPHRDPMGLGSRPAWLPLRDVVTGSLPPRPPPGAPRYLASLPAFVQRSAHHQRRRGCLGLPDARRTTAGSACQRAHAGACPGERTRGTQACPSPSLEEKKSLRSHGCAGGAHSLASDSWQLQQHCHQNFPGAESHFRVFLAHRSPLRSLFPGKTAFTANSRKSELQKCIFPRPPSPPPDLGSLPKVGARSGASCPIPGSGVLRRGAANSPW